MSNTSQNSAAKKTTTRRAPAKKTAPKVEAEVEAETTEDAPVEPTPDVVDQPADDVVVADKADEADENYSYTLAALEKHGIDPQGIPTYNAFFDNGYIRIRGSREFGIVTDFTPWPNQVVRDEVTDAYRRDRAR